MATVKGVWNVNEVIVLDGTQASVNFNVVGERLWQEWQAFDYTYFAAYSDANGLMYGYATAFPYKSDGGWIDQKYRYIDFGEVEQEVDDAFYTWLTNNAMPHLTTADRLRIIAENEPKVYEAGKKTERERFWDRYLKMHVWTRAFIGYGFGFDNFYPTRDIKPVGDASQLFYAWENKSGDHNRSLKQRLEECGVVLDTSQATNLSNAFGYFRGTELPTIDFTGITTNSSGVFGYAYDKLHTIEKIKVKEDTTFTNWFKNTNLANVTFDGVIGNDIDLSYSTRLTADSIKNIIEHLSDTASGKTLTLSKTAVDNAEANLGFGGYIVFQPNAMIGGSYFNSNPIFLEAGQRLKVELTVADNHFYSTATYDTTKYGSKHDDPNYWRVGLSEVNIMYSEPKHRSLIYTANASGSVIIQGYLERYTIDDSSQEAKFAIRAVLVDDGGNEISGENLYSFVPFSGATSVSGSFEDLKNSKPNWTISLV